MKLALGGRLKSEMRPFPEIHWLLPNFSSQSSLVQTDPKIPPFENNPQAGSVPPPLPASEPPETGAPPPLIAAPPPSLPPQAKPKSVSVRKLLAILLSLCLGLF